MAQLTPSRMWTICGLLALFTAAAGAQYELEDSYVGVDFLEKWDFFTSPDPANGHVDYVDAATASREGLATATPNRVFMGVDMATNTNGTKRKSVRVHSKTVYNGGLFIVDVEHMPVGCGTWPAFWMYGEDPLHTWPAWGEYDIIETMHNDNTAMTTLHTGAACSQAHVKPAVDFQNTWKLGENQLPANDCNVNAAGQYQNQGCSQAGLAESAGPAFNSRGGGTFAGEWDPVVGHIRTWFWPTGLEPLDIRKRKPDPSKWGQPASFFSLSRRMCAPEHFRNMRLVFNVDLCGDLGNALFAQSCPREARTMTCEQYISDPEQMKEAYWSLRSLDVFTKSSDADYLMFAEHPERYPLEPQAANPVRAFFTSRTGLSVVLLLVVVAVAALGAKWSWHRVAGPCTGLRDADAEEPMCGNRGEPTPTEWALPWPLSVVSTPSQKQSDVERNRLRSASSESSTLWSGWSRTRSQSGMSNSRSTPNLSGDWSNWSPHAKL